MTSDVSSEDDDENNDSLFRSLGSIDLKSKCDIRKGPTPFISQLASPVDTAKNSIFERKESDIKKKDSLHITSEAEKIMENKRTENIVFALR
jgi:hypothetical protein